MRPPDPSQPVLFRTSRQLAVYRYVLPLAVAAPLVFLAFAVPPEARGDLAPFVLPVVVLVAGLILHGRNLREARVTEEGIVVGEAGAEHLVEWHDIDWATEIWMNPPTLVVRLKAGVPILPPWFLLLPQRERRFGWRPQPMSRFVAEKTREAQAARPERALEYGRWPSRAALTLRVIGSFIVLFLGAFALAMWLHGRTLPERFPGDPGGGPPISTSLEVARAPRALTPGSPNP